MLAGYLDERFLFVTEAQYSDMISILTGLACGTIFAPLAFLVYQLAK